MDYSFFFFFFGIMASAGVLFRWVVEADFFQVHIPSPLSGVIWGMSIVGLSSSFVFL
jgi:hypothetical protein